MSLAQAHMLLKFLGGVIRALPPKIGKKGTMAQMEKNYIHQIYVHGSHVLTQLMSPKANSGAITDTMIQQPENPYLARAKGEIN